MQAAKSRFEIGSGGTIGKDVFPQAIQRTRVFIPAINWCVFSIAGICFLGRNEQVALVDDSLSSFGAPSWLTSTS